MRSPTDEEAPLSKKWWISLLLVLVLPVLAQADLTERAEQAKSESEWHRLLSDPDAKRDPLTQGQDPSLSWEAQRDQVVTMLRERDRLGLPPDGATTTPVVPPSPSGNAPSILDPKKQAEEILENPLYRVRETRQRETWVGESMETFFRRIQEWFENLFKRPEREAQGPNLSLPSGLTNLVWLIIVVTVVAFVIWAIMKIALPQRQNKRTSAGGLLEDGEPDRTADEWLGQADELAAKGEYRRAVRALYLALLMKADDHGIARFLRHETNWEHLARIEGSTRVPRDLDFRGVTQRFDLVWYGSIVDGRSDYDWFREQYTRISQLLSAREAAS